MRTLRNTDLKEVTLVVEGRTVLKFALAYGFRNIQTLLRKVKRGVAELPVLWKIMACPLRLPERRRPAATPGWSERSGARC